jgi:short-subunit dehydrogenase
MKIENKTVLITGASSGLGREVALSLAKRNNNLIVTARRDALLQTLKAEIEALGSRCLAVAADSIDTAQAANVIEAGIRAFGRIDVALLNAGGGKALFVTQGTVAEILNQMRTNYDTLVNYLYPLIDHMKERGGGTIAYTSSPAGYFGLPKAGPYSAAKAAGRTLFDSTRMELAKTPVKLVALYPGFTYTEGMDANEVPVKALIIERDRAAREMIAAMEAGKTHHMFPKRIVLLMSLARLLPEPVRRRVLGMNVDLQDGKKQPVVR